LLSLCCPRTTEIACCRIVFEVETLLLFRRLLKRIEGRSFAVATHKLLCRCWQITTEWGCDADYCLEILFVRLQT
ncbi:hypothetical protein ACLOJK_006536, partial [Asimina triloba]